MDADKMRELLRIESDFDSWFEFGESWTAERVGEQSIEERVTNLENALLEMLGV